MPAQDSGLTIRGRRLSRAGAALLSGPSPVMPERPIDKLVRAVVRRALDQIREQLYAAGLEELLPHGHSLTVRTSDEAFQLGLELVRLLPTGGGPTLPLPSPLSPPPSPPADPAPPSAPTEPPDMKPIHKRLLKKAAELGEPVPARKLIQAAGYKYNSSSRGAVTYLYQHHLLHRDPLCRYHLPPAPEPATGSARPA